MAISPQWLTIYLYSAHHALIFAIAQLYCRPTSCYGYNGKESVRQMWQWTELHGIFLSPTNLRIKQMANKVTSSGNTGTVLIVPLDDICPSSTGTL